MPTVRRGRIAAVALALGAAALVAWALAAGLGGGSPRRLVVGGVEDAAKWSDPAGNMARARRAALRGDRAQLRVDARCHHARQPGARQAPNGRRCRPARRHPADRRRLLVRRRHARDAAPAARLRRVRGRDPPRDAGAALHQPRERAQLEHVLAPAVRRRRDRRGRGLLLPAPPHGVPARQGGRAARHRDRRLAGGARQRQPVRAPQDPLPYPLHPRPRPRVPGERTPEASARPLLASPVSRELVDPADGRRSALDGDRHRGLPEARRAPHGGLREAAADRLRGVRHPDADPPARARPLLREARLVHPAGQRGAPGRRLRRRRSSSPPASRSCGCSSSST